MEKMKFPMGTRKAARLLNTTQRTIRNWCNKFRFTHIDSENMNTAFQIENAEQFQQIENNIKHKRGNPNWC